MRRNPQVVFFIVLGVGLVAVILSMLGQFNMLQGDFLTISTNYTSILGIIMIAALCIYYLVTKR